MGHRVDHGPVRAEAGEVMVGSFEQNGKWTNPYWLDIRRENGDKSAVTRSFDDLQRYLGGWVEDSGRNPIIYSNGIAETRGNATVVSWYKVLGDTCWWYGHYQLGNTTGWNNAAGFLELALPLGVEATTFVTSFASMAGSVARAYNGNFFFGHGEIASNSRFGMFDAAVANTRWSVQAATPFAWGANHILSWNLWYRLDPKART